MPQTQTPAQLLNRAAELISQAARGQHAAEPDHRDFSSLGLAAERALDALFAVNGNLGGQLAHYSEGRRLRTDTDRSPAQVLAAAMDHGRTIDLALRQARTAAHGLAAEAAQLAVLPDDADDEGLDGTGGELDSPGRWS